jgi:hypothetical protein
MIRASLKTQNTYQKTMPAIPQIHLLMANDWQNIGQSKPYIDDAGRLWLIKYILKVF